MSYVITRLNRLSFDDVSLVPVRDNPEMGIRRGLLRLTRDDVEGIFEPIVLVRTAFWYF